MKVTLLHRSAGRRVDGVLDYSRQLTDALSCTEGITSSSLIYLRERARPWLREDGVDRRIAIPQAIRAIARSDWVILQYSPFGLGRWGVAPWTIPVLAAIRTQSRVSLFVHEPYVRDQHGRRRAMQWWQRGQLACVGRVSQLSLVSIGPWVELVRADAPRTPAEHVVVGSNLPDRRSMRASKRRQLGIEDHHIVVAVFGTGHDSNLYGHIAAALDALTGNGVRFTFVQLGIGRAAEGGSPEHLVRPGWLPAEEVAGFLAAADVLLSPYVDGVSTRRTTIAAATQHGVPIVTTHGTSSGPLDDWTDRGLVLTAVDDVQGFAHATVALVTHPSRRAELAAQARAYYEHELAWPVISERIAGLLAAHR